PWEKTTPKPNVASCAFCSTTKISCLGRSRLASSANRSPAGPAPRTPMRGLFSMVLVWPSHVVAIDPLGLMECWLGGDPPTQREAGVAPQPRPGRRQMIGLAARSGPELDAPGARDALLFVAPQCACQVLGRAGDMRSQRTPVLERLCRPLCEVRQHGVGRIAQQGHAILTPLRQRLPVVERPFVAALACIEKLEQPLAPAGIRTYHLGHVAFPRPGFLRPGVG